MTDSAQEEAALKQLGQEPARLLDIIDKLRDLDLERLVELPQLIVCGNQSCGKSSTLEAISRVSFPVGSGVCTRFPIEVIIRKNDPRSGRISIRPGNSRVDKNIQNRLKEFSVPCSSGADLPAAIELAKERMGIADIDGANGGFCDDVLEVRIAGKQDITLVDLPGLYGAKSKEQGAAGIRFVRDLMKQYMSNKRSIILAIVSAGYPYHNQEVLDRAEEYDPGRERTLGIITHPDKVEPNSDDERGWIEHAKNEHIKLKLGWHVIRNRASGEKDTGNEIRDGKESEFFSQGKWARLPRECTGVDSLRNRLGKVLLDHISLQLPELIDDIKGKINERRSKLLTLGECRSTVPEQRKYLVEKSGMFQLITDHAVNGMYIDEFFTRESTGPSYYSNRLRAVIRNLNGEFANKMRLEGCKRQIIGDDVQAQAQGQTQTRPNLQNGNSGRQAEPCHNPNRPSIKRADLERDIREKARVNRGLELPGCPNPILVGDLFRDQVEPWEGIAHDHLIACWNATENFVVSLLEHLADESTSRLLLHSVLLPKLEKMKSNLLEKLEELTKYHKTGHLLPFDETFLSSLHKLQKNRQSAASEQKNSSIFGINFEKSPAGQDARAAVDATAAAGQEQTDQYAASDTIDLMEAYYNISITTFIDNVAILAIENCLVQPIRSIFTPLTISEMGDEEIRQLAAEPGYIQINRQQLKADLKQLEDGLRICEQYNTSQSYLRKVNEGILSNKGRAMSPNNQNQTNRATEHLPGKEQRQSNTTPTKAGSKNPQPKEKTSLRNGNTTSSFFSRQPSSSNEGSPSSSQSSASGPDGTHKVVVLEVPSTDTTPSSGKSSPGLFPQSLSKVPSVSSTTGSITPATAQTVLKGGGTLFPTTFPVSRADGDKPSSNQKPITGSLFSGAASSKSPSTRPFAFGSHADKPSSGSGLFGSTPSAAKPAQPSTGLFGTGATETTGGLFGAPAAKKPATSTGRLFGSLAHPWPDSGAGDAAAATTKPAASKSPTPEPPFMFGTSPLKTNGRVSPLPNGKG